MCHALTSNAGNGEARSAKEDQVMRTTIEIDDDILSVARELAKQQNKTVGQVVSALARQALTTGVRSAVRNGVPLFSPLEIPRPVTMEMVNRLRGEEE
jgi:Arc/MetJ family transcription regulator